MALLLAIILMMRMVVYALTWLALICAANCPYGSTSLCSDTAQVVYVRGAFTVIQEEIESDIEDSMTVMQKTAQAVSQTFPALAALEAYNVGTNKDYKDNFAKSDLQVVVSPLPVGSDMSLPTTNGTTDQLCDQAVNVVDEGGGAVSLLIPVPVDTIPIFQGLFWLELASAKSALCSDVPTPIIFSDDWKDHKDTRAYSITTDSNVDARRKSVAIASKTKLASPITAQFLATAEAEFYAENGSGHDDLWHMDWRARLERYTTDSSSTSPVAALTAFTSFLASVGGGDLQNELSGALMRKQRGAIMLEFLIIIPAAMLMFYGIDYFRSTFVRRLTALNQSQATAWHLASSNDGSCYTSNETWVDRSSTTNPLNNASRSGSAASGTYAGQTGSTMFKYNHTDQHVSMATKQAMWNGNATGKKVRGRHVHLVQRGRAGPRQRRRFVLRALGLH